MYINKTYKIYWIYNLQAFMKWKKTNWSAPLSTHKQPPATSLSTATTSYLSLNSNHLLFHLQHTNFTSNRELEPPFQPPSFKSHWSWKRQHHWRLPLTQIATRGGAFQLRPQSCRCCSYVCRSAGAEVAGQTSASMHLWMRQ